MLFKKIVNQPTFRDYVVGPNVVPRALGVKEGAERGRPRETQNAVRLAPKTGVGRGP